METQELTEERMKVLEAREKRQLEPRSCIDCGILKPGEEFYKDSNLRRHNVCKACCNVRYKGRYNHKDGPRKEVAQRLSRKYRLKKHYKLSLEEYNELVEKQNGKCAICKNPPTSRGKSGSKLNVDHNHSTGQVRELLCWHCNSLLGNAFENLEILKGAVEYLERHTTLLSAEELKKKGGENI